MAIATSISSAQVFVSRSRRRIRAFGVLATVVGALVVWTIEGPILGARMEVPQNGTVEHITWDRVLFVSTLVSLLGWGLLTVLERVAARYARAIWTVPAVLLLLVSFYKPFFNPGVTLGTRVGLSIIHITVAAILMTVMRQTAKSS